MQFPARYRTEGAVGDRSTRVVTFGCRVNQADSLAIEGALRARGARQRVARRGRPRRREHLLGHRDRRSGRAADDPPHRAQQPRCAGRRHRLLRDAAARTSCASFRTSSRVVSNQRQGRPARASLGDRSADSTASDSATATARAARARAWRRRAHGASPCGCRPAAKSAAATASFRRRAAQSRSRPLTEISVSIDARRRGRLQGDRHHRRAPRLVRPRPCATARRSTALVRTSGDMGRATCCSASVRWSRWIARTEIVDLVAASPRLAPHFHLPLQHGADACCVRCGVRTRRPRIARSSSGSARVMPHASIGSDVIVGFPGETRRATSRRRESLLRDASADASSRVSRTPIARAPTRARCRTRSTARRSASVASACARSVSEMATRFRRSQVGTMRRALTVDDGWSAVTDNYLKVRLDAAAVPRNRVDSTRRID